MIVARGWMAVAVAIGTLGTASAGQAACEFQKIAEVPVTMEGTRPTIMAKINGQDAKFLVDTGAVFSAVTEETVAKYSMKRSVAPFGLVAEGVGGAKRDVRAVAADNFTFAGVGFRNTQFMLVGRAGGEAGLVGENLMGPFDVEYDFANGAIRYFKPTGCGYEANLAYWSQGLSVSKISLIDPTNILTRAIANAKVDGHTIRVLLDSGASLSVLSRPAAARAGVKMDAEGVVAGGITYGVYGKGLEEFLVPFASFAIGGEEIKNTRLRVSDLEMKDSDMLLGADFFLSHRILISNSQKKVYFTYNGGPVFRLDRAPQQQQAQAATPGPDGTAAALQTNPALGDPKTGPEFARRAAAEAARREFPLAIADYTRAIDLEPTNPGHYRGRATVRMAAGQPVLAMADLDEALKRQPDDAETLTRRGALYLTTRDPVRAKADFDAAMKLSPGNSSLVAQVGAAYARAGLYEPALHELDGWILAHPKAEDLPQVLNIRCFTRAAWGKELDAALADCDAAMKRDKTSEVMENRGLVLLRMGRLDESIAQYTAAIRVQPRAAPALYGRGLAELKKGQKAEGEADLAAARAIAPGLAQQYKRFGLAPDDAGAPSAKS